MTKKDDKINDKILDAIAESQFGIKNISKYSETHDEKEELKKGALKASDKILNNKNSSDEEIKLAKIARIVANSEKREYTKKEKQFLEEAVFSFIDGFDDPKDSIDTLLHIVSNSLVLGFEIGYLSAKGKL